MDRSFSDDHERLFEATLNAADPTARLADVVSGLLKQGVTQRELLQELRDFRKRLRNQNRPTEEDAVLEVMDFLVGWSAPEASLDNAGTSGQKPGTPKAAAFRPRADIRLPDVRLVFPGTAGLWADRHQAALLRELYFPRTAVSNPTIAILDLQGIFPTPGVLEDLILPIAQGIRGGVYGPLLLVVSTPDRSVVDFLNYLARTRDVPLFVVSYPEQVRDAEPVGNLTSTDRTTLNVLMGVGGTVTASQLANRVGIEQTAAGNRLVNLANKGFLYRITQPGREGDLFVDPRSVVDPAAVQRRELAGAR